MNLCYIIHCFIKFCELYMESNIKATIEKIESLNVELQSKKNSAENVIDACNAVGKSWSGSTLVGHAKFFYLDFEEPDATHRFSIEWGLIHGIPSGWMERNDEEVRERIETISKENLEELINFSISIEERLVDLQREAVLTLSTIKGIDIEKLEKFSFKSATDHFNDIFPTRYMTRDTEAITGRYVVPHIRYKAMALYIKNLPEDIKSFIFEIKKAVNNSKNSSGSTIDGRVGYYIENLTILKLTEIKSDKFDLAKLIKLCKELNDNYSLENYLSCGMILRSILDHIPPIFGKNSFDEVSSNYGTNSFKDVVKPLQESSKKIANSYLHTQVRSKEVLPTKSQVSFQPNLDFLLQEIIRILK